MKQNFVNEIKRTLLSNWWTIGRYLRHLALFSLLALGSVAVSNPTDESALCDGSLTIDDRFGILKSSQVDDAQFAKETTNLLNEALTPYLKSVSQKIQSLAVSELRSLLGSFGGKSGRSGTLSGKKGPKDFPHKLYDLSLFDGRYDGSWIWRDQDFFGWYAPFTKFNEQFMFRFIRAVAATRSLENKLVDYKSDPNIRGSQILRASISYVGSDFERSMYFSYTSILQATAQLTADSVEGFTLAQLLEGITRQTGSCPSLVSISSLAYAPTLLGPYGDDIYVKNSVVGRQEKFEFSPKFIKFLKTNNKTFQAVPFSGRDAWELGEGCPVGHLLKGESRTGVQYLLDAIMYVFDHLPEVEK